LIIVNATKEAFFFVSFLFKTHSTQQLRIVSYLQSGNVVSLYVLPRRLPLPRCSFLTAEHGRSKTMITVVINIAEKPIITAISIQLTPVSKKNIPVARSFVS
jgi:hypothetical protein